MKRIISILIILILVLSLFGCKTKPQSENEVASSIIEETNNSAGSDKTQPTDTPITEKQPTEQTQQPEQSTTEQVQQVDKEELPEQQQTSEQPIEQQQENSSVSEIQPDENADAIDNSNLNESSVVNLPGPFVMATGTVSDSFVATVIEAKSLKGQKISFHNVPDEADNYCLYTVKIEKMHRQTFVKHGMTIYYIVKCAPDDQYWYNPLEVGKKYLLSGFAQEYNGKPVIYGLGHFDSEIKDDNTLVPVSFNYKISKFKTLDEFESDDEFKEYCQSEFSDIAYFDAMIFIDLETARRISGNSELLDVKEIDKQTFISYVIENIAVE